ncbi:hypothetical protein CYMTET_19472 [Cymbomonas tetramitiformis]|uniref:Uncharacterized protein n=1 Tax=Cymbomonas tetramitiformis TaxID=36881 RepID=A0AAE0G6I1_9CHLO|nr:hypothetical protein CYMTET_19472 [Cymbomonas tetramitiformis]
MPPFCSAPFPAGWALSIGRPEGRKASNTSLIGRLGLRQCRALVRGPRRLSAAVFCDAAIYAVTSKGLVARYDATSGSSDLSCTFGQDVALSTLDVLPTASAALVALAGEGSMVRPWDTRASHRQLGHEPNAAEFNLCAEGATHMHAVQLAGGEGRHSDLGAPLLACACNDGLRVYDLRHASKPLISNNGGVAARHVAFMTGSELCALSAAGNLEVWDTCSASLSRSFKEANAVDGDGLALCSQARVALMGCKGGTCAVDLVNGSLAQASLPLESATAQVAWSMPEAPTNIEASVFCTADVDGTITVWS